MADEVLVALLPNRRDLTIAWDEHWYRVPVASARKWLAERWPPQWLAFYQPRVFREDAFAIRYYARVREVRTRQRCELFPDEPRTRRSTDAYYQLLLGPIQTLAYPIYSRRWRRIVFISTTWEKFVSAAEINDLYDGSPLEDRLWAELKRFRIPAERQEFVRIGGQQYALDFAIHCAGGSIDVETDGDTWHATPARAAEDNLRDNALESKGWRVLRFSTRQVEEDGAGYCLRTIAETINTLGGIDEGRAVPRNVSIAPGSQLGLFDGP